MQDIVQIDLDRAKKSELKAVLKSVLPQLESLRASVSRLLRQPPIEHQTAQAHPDDTVPAGWAARHGIAIPRADGIHESPMAWVRVKNGSIIGAGLKNQSILLLMISLGLLDQGAEHHGNLYKDWRAAFHSRLDQGKSGEPGGGDPDAWTKEDRYCKLIHRLDRDHLAAMDTIVAARPKSKHLAALQANQSAFVDAFLAVVEVMRQINREAEKALQNEKMVARQSSMP